ncbi:MAG TPA: hypothetical protein VFX55_01055 [Duganella sp.]|nr:hypothetical protein [Duganella sp.]
MSVIFDDEKPEAYYWRMNTEKRIDKLEVDDESHKATLVYLQANSASKDDIREVKVMIAESEGRMLARIAQTETRIAEAKASIIQWVVTAVFIAQLLPALLKLFLPG